MKKNNHFLIRSLLLWTSSLSFMMLTSPIKFSALIKVGIISCVLLVILIIFRKKLKKFNKVKPVYWCISCFIVVAGAIQFCFLSAKLDFVQMIYSVLHIKGYLVLIILAFIFMLGALPAVAYWLKVLIEDVFKIRKNHWQTIKQLAKPTLILSIIYCISIISIIRANFSYNDDMWRAMEGHKDWGPSFSRFLSDFFSNYLHCNFYLTDISPLTQIIAMIILAIASVLLIYIFKRNTKFSLIEYCAVIPLAINPYFLQCISYKFDSPYMAISIIISILPMILCVKENKNNHNYVGLFVACVFSTLFVCMTYQSSLGILPILVIVFCAFNKTMGNWTSSHSKKVFLFSALGYIFGILFFYFIFMDNRNSYIDASIPSMDIIIPLLIDNYNQFFLLIKCDFNILWLGLVILCVINFIVCFTYKRKGNKLLSISIAILVLIVTTLLMFGVYPWMQKTSSDPRAMIGLGAWLAIINIAAVSFLNKAKVLILGKIFICIIAWVFFVFSFTYGNALSAQKEYIDNKTDEIASDINYISRDNNTRMVQIHGSMGFTPAVINSADAYPILKRLVPCLLKEKWMWGVYTLAEEYNLPIYADYDAEPVDDSNMTSFTNTYDYDIKYNNKYIIINIHEHSKETALSKIFEN